MTEKELGQHLSCPALPPCKFRIVRRQSGPDRADARWRSSYRGRAVWRVSGGAGLRLAHLIAPDLGEHNETVLKQYLGYDADHVAQLTARMEFADSL